MVVTPDMLRAYFSSNRAGSQNYDVFTATRATKTDPWSGIVKVPELSGPGAQYPSWVSPDGCRLYITTSQPDGANAAVYDIVVAERPAN